MMEEEEEQARLEIICFKRIFFPILNDGGRGLRKQARLGLTTIFLIFNDDDVDDE